MDANECNTEWDVLLRIRKEKANYKIGGEQPSP